MFGVFSAKMTCPIYRDVRRLRPASRIRLDRDGFDVQRYWTIPYGSEIRYKKDADYVEHFKTLFEKAVHDRLRAPGIAFELSGGLDSTSVAAIAVPAIRAAGGHMTGYTMTCHQFLPDDEEGFYAGQVASHLGMTNVQWAIENFPSPKYTDTISLNPAEPSASLDLMAHHLHLVEMQNDGARILLTGQGGDAVMAGSNRQSANLFRDGQWLRLFREVALHAIRTGSLSGSGLRHALWPRSIQTGWQPEQFPTWLNPDFVRRAGLRERWTEMWACERQSMDAYHQLHSPWFGSHIAGYSDLQAPIEARHPFYDRRLVTYLLALPNFVTARKQVLRNAISGRLPAAVLNRPGRQVCREI